MMNGTVYLLHFSQPISVQHSCQHYLGWALNLEARLAEHRAGRGARLTQVALERGIDFVVVQTWPGDRTLERRLKNRKESPRFCPLCFPVVRCRHLIAPAIEAIQLALPLPPDDPFPVPPALPIDGYEIAVLRGWRVARRVPQLGDNWDEGLL